MHSLEGAVRGMERVDKLFVVKHGDKSGYHTEWSQEMRKGDAHKLCIPAVRLQVPERNSNRNYRKAIYM